MVAFQNVLAFIGGATIPLSAMIYRQLNPPHTAYQDCLEHLMELDQRAKETWQRSEIPDGTWIKSKTRLTHTALCNMHHGLERIRKKNMDRRNETTHAVSVPTGLSIGCKTGRLQIRCMIPYSREIHKFEDVLSSYT
ncbi:uncharacterized protein EAF01_005414 [Botrytis porri]|uniref:uncharacterized protein n=1 Tax=Botrytis porri TaxID=87229 RepID=UPI001902836D|nr:uncharacterized protein EAF01_005414 [Botrytis porri]KAF7904892.1 hypothetical protein EAF01_005414 [Botrytis porri]